MRGLRLLLCASILCCADLQADDWPMLAHDLARTGATADEPPAMTRRAWVRYFHLDGGLMPSVQPVVVKDRVYLGTMSGSFHCIDAASGQDVWIAKLGGPVFHTPCVSQGVVAVGAGDGKVYGLNSDDGRVLWSFQTGAAIWNSPLPHSGNIYIGGRDGIFYCLKAADGGLVWRYDAGAPICQSPAIDLKRGRVYFTDETMAVHALDLASGELAWRSEQFYGTTARSFHPVIAPDGTVMVSTIPIYSWDRAHRPLKQVTEALFGTQEFTAEQSNHPGRYVKIPSWQHKKETNAELDKHVRGIFLQPGYFDRMAELLLDEVQADPASQCLYLLDPETGKQRAIAPVLYTAFAKSQFTPPLVTPEGRVITKWCAFLPSTFGAYQREVNLCHIDPATGEVAPFFDESRVNSGTGLGLIADESCQMTLSGKYILNLNLHFGEQLKSFERKRPEASAASTLYDNGLHAYGIWSDPSAAARRG